mgnify:CR=1 FL=1
MTLSPSELHRKLRALLERLQARAAEDPSWAESLEAVEHLLPLVAAGAEPQPLTRSQLVAFGMLLRDSEFKGASSYAELRRRAARSKGEDRFGHRAEFLRLVDVAESLTALRQSRQKITVFLTAVCVLVVVMGSMLSTTTELSPALIHLAERQRPPCAARAWRLPSTWGYTRCS